MGLGHDRSIVSYSEWTELPIYLPSRNLRCKYRGDAYGELRKRLPSSTLPEERYSLSLNMQVRFYHCLHSVRNIPFYVQSCSMLW